MPDHKCNFNVSIYINMKSCLLPTCLETLAPLSVPALGTLNEDKVYKRSHYFFFLLK